MSARRDHPALTQVLADPLVRLMMRADGVDPDRLAEDFGAIAATLRRRRAGTPVWRTARPASRRSRSLCHA